MTDRKSLFMDPEFTKGHSNFPRHAWTTWGLGFGTLLACIDGWPLVLGVFLFYFAVWAVWAMYLLGRRASAVGNTTESATADDSEDVPDEWRDWKGGDC